MIKWNQSIDLRNYEPLCINFFPFLWSLCFEHPNSDNHFVILDSTRFNTIKICTFLQFCMMRFHAKLSYFIAFKLLTLGFLQLDANRMQQVVLIFIVGKECLLSLKLLLFVISREPAKERPLMIKDQ